MGVRDRINELLDITFDEYCKKCDSCEGNCYLNTIELGISNIFGNEIILVKEDI